MDKKKVIELIKQISNAINWHLIAATEIAYDTKCKVLEKLEEVKSELSKSDWVSVEDELPPYNEEVWCRVEDVAGVHYFQSSRFEGKDRIPVLKYDENGFDVISVLQHVTHWRKIDKLEV